MKRPPCLIVLLVFAVAGPACSESRGNAGISADDMRGHVRYLAADGLRGRETGEPGIGKAEEYVAKAFAGAGLAPLPGRDSFFVDFPLYRRGVDVASTSLAVQVAGRSERFAAGSGFRPFGFSSDGKASAQVVFAGYGITAPEHDYDDFEGLDVEGKFVLVFRHEPGENDPTSNFDGTSSSNHALFSSKARQAQEHGAAGMLLVTDPLNHESADDMRLDGRLALDPPNGGSRDGDDEAFLALHIGRDVADKLVAPSGMTLAELQAAVDAGRRPAEFPLDGVSAEIAVGRAEKPEEVAARNVAAYLEGSDPKRKNEWIVVGGHHDHVGGFDGAGDTVFNGADDNASGTSGVIELAQAFAARAERPARSIVFVTFSGEEKGLLGSRWLVREGVLPVNKMVFMLNLDMIGRNSGSPIQVYGDGFVKGLRSVVETKNALQQLPLEFAGDGYAGNSDHDPFYKEDIPFTFFFTGTHEDYHQLGDHAEKLDYERMEKIVKLAYGVVETLADGEDAPGFIHNVGWLGAQVEVQEGREGEQAIVTRVEADSRAAAAGLTEGDVIAAFGELALDKPKFVGKRFRKIDPGDSETLSILRDGETLSVTVERARTGYMGIVPGPLDEDVRDSLGIPDNEGILLRQVVADGPSGKAGLKDGDIVLRIAGSPVNPNSLRRQLQRIGAGETVELTVLRDGERLTVPVTLGERPSRG